MSKFFYLVLFFVISVSAFAEYNHSQSNYLNESSDNDNDETISTNYHQEISFEDFDNGVSVHMCPVENWSSYKIRIENNRFSENLTLLADIAEHNTSRSSVYITWPTTNQIIVICGKNVVIIKSTLNTTVAIVGNQLFNW